MHGNNKHDIVKLHLHAGAWQQKLQMKPFGISRGASVSRLVQGQQVHRVDQILVDVVDDTEYIKSQPDLVTVLQMERNVPQSDSPEAHRNASNNVAAS